MARRPSLRSWLLSAFVVLVGSGPGFASGAPEVDKALTAAPGFRLRQFAGAPDVDEATGMAFDARGRLWVAARGADALGSIRILDDRDGDGRADQTIVFADGLWRPSGLAIGPGGAFVACGHELLFLSDADGDDRAERQRVVLGGFEAWDGDDALQGLRWGPDGGLRMATGEASESLVETAHGMVKQEGAARFVYGPRTGRLDVTGAGGSGHPDGLAFDRWGREIRCQPARIDRPRARGVEILSGPSWPGELQGALVVAETDTAGRARIGRYRLHEAGAGLRAEPAGAVRFELSAPAPHPGGGDRMTSADARSGMALLTANSDATRILDLAQGPDGALYVATSDGIWNLTAVDRPPVTQSRPAADTLARRLEGLKAPDAPTRDRVRGSLAGSEAATVASALADWVRTLDPADPDVEHHRLEALWAYQQIGRLDMALLTALLRSPGPHARAAATRLLKDHRERVPDALDRLAAQVVDPSPLVRLEAVTALGLIPGPRAVELATLVLGQPRDRVLDEALRRTIAAQQPTWLPVFESGDLRCQGDPARLEALLLAAPPEIADRAANRLVRAESLSPAARARLLAFLAERGTSVDLPDLLDRLTRLADPADKVRALEGLVNRAVRRTVGARTDPLNLPPGPLRGLLEDPDDALMAETALLIGAAKLTSLRPELVAMARDPRGDIFRRLAAIHALSGLGGIADREVLTALGGSEHPVLVRLEATSALDGLDHEAAAARAAEILCSSDAYRADPSPLLRALLVSTDGAALARALADRSVPPDVARLALRVLEIERPTASALRARLRSAAGLPPRPAPLSDAEAGRLAAAVRTRGDRDRGEAVFVRPDVGCLCCHSLRGVGGTRAVALDRLQPALSAESLVRAIHGPGPHASTELMAAADRIDLIRFLAEIGWDEGAASSADNVIRHWRVLDPVSSDLAGVPLDALAARLDGISRTWTPAYSLSSGVLPVTSFAPAPRQPIGFVRCAVEVTIGGEFQLKLDDPHGVSLLVDGRPVALASDPVRLDYGPHVLTFRIDRRERGRTGLRVELAPAAGSSGEVRMASDPVPSGTPPR